MTNATNTIRITFIDDDCYRVDINGRELHRTFTQAEVTRAAAGYEAEGWTVIG